MKFAELQEEVEDGSALLCFKVFSDMAVAIRTMKHYGIFGELQTTGLLINTVLPCHSID
jgi:hypothetical protein